VSSIPRAVQVRRFLVTWLGRSPFNSRNPLGGSVEWSVLITPVASFFGAGLAARLAVKSFYKEKVWERKAEAYTVIFGAISEMNNWFSVHQDAYESDTEMSKEEKEELWTSFKSEITHGVFKRSGFA